MQNHDITESIQTLKSTLQDADARVLAIDIDDTISATGPQYIGKIQQAFGNPEGLSPIAMWEKYGRGDVPYWNMEEVRNWCLNHIEDPKFHLDCHAIQGAVMALGYIDEFFLKIGLYLTIRTEPLRSCTDEWLRTYDFPIAPLVMMPSSFPHRHGMIWKARVLEYLYPEVVGIVDDRAELLGALSPSYQGTVFLYRHDETEYLRAVACPTWDHVCRRVRHHSITTRA